MACSHEGDTALARAIIDGAGAAGADAIQFQIWTIKACWCRSTATTRRSRRLELSQPQWAELAAYVRQRHPHMQIIACVQEHQSIDFCQSIDRRRL